MIQNRDNLPYFPCYAKNFLANKHYRQMSFEERGLLFSIYNECWANFSVPSDPEELAKLLGFPAEQVKKHLTSKVLYFFKQAKGELISPQLEEYYEKQQALKIKRSEGGKKGMNKRYREANSVITQLQDSNNSVITHSNQIKSNQINSNPIQSTELISNNSSSSNTKGSSVDPVDPDIPF